MVVEGLVVEVVVVEDAAMGGIPCHAHLALSL